jgi:hypothetical protein
MQFDESLSSPSMVPPDPPSGPPSPPPAAGERIVAHVREALTDLAGLGLAAYLVQRNAIHGTHALLFALALLLPSPVLVRVARAIASRGRASSAGPAALALALSGAYSKLKLTALGVAVIAASSACSPSFNAVTPIAPRVVLRADYGTCVESGGRMSVLGGPTLAMLTQACLSFDAGSEGAADEGDASADASGGARPEVTHTFSRTRAEERR